MNKITYIFLVVFLVVLSSCSLPKGNEIVKKKKEVFHLADIDREIMVLNSDNSEPYIFNYKDEDFQKGYTIDNGKLALHTISEMIGGTVTFVVGEKPEFDKEKYARIISVPFTVTTGKVNLYSPDSPKTIHLEKGTYSLYFTVNKKDDYDDDTDNEYGLYFIPKDNPKYEKIIFDI